MTTPFATSQQTRESVDPQNAMQMRLEEICDREIETNDLHFQEWLCEHTPPHLAAFIAKALCVPQIAIWRAGHTEAFVALCEDVGHLREEYRRHRETTMQRRGELEQLTGGYGDELRQWAAEHGFDAADIPTLDGSGAKRV